MLIWKRQAQTPHCGQHLSFLSYVFFITRIRIPSLQENAHFSISESLIAAIELMKCNMRRPADEAEEDGDSDSEIQQLKQKIRLRRLQIRRTRLKPPVSSNNRKMRCLRPRYTHGKVLFHSLLRVKINVCSDEFLANIPTPSALTFRLICKYVLCALLSLNKQNEQL